MPSLNAKVERELRGAGASLVGFADVSALPASVTGGMPRAISIVVRLDPTIVREIENGPTPRYFAEYNRINALLVQLSDRAACLLTNAGYRADPVRTTTGQFNSVTLSMPVQHKTIATRAGLGWIGKSALLVTKEYGPAVRLGSVLTDADLQPGTPIDTSNCGSCRQCVDRCPAQAIVGDNWQAGAPRESIYGASTCRATATRLSSQAGFQATICGICINACPWTQRYLSRARSEPGVETGSDQA
jgi:epoxyqueuosine reductase QueG